MDDFAFKAIDWTILQGCVTFCKIKLDAARFCKIPQDFAKRQWWGTYKCMIEDSAKQLNNDSSQYSIFIICAKFGAYFMWNHPL